MRIAARRTMVERDAPGPRWARRLWAGVAAASVLGVGLATVQSANDQEDTSSASGSSQAAIDYSDPAVSAYLSRLNGYGGSATSDTDGLVLAGYQSCQWWSEGYTTTQVMQGVTQHYGPRLGLNADGTDTAGAPPITTAAMVELCPEVGAFPAARY